MPAAVPHGRLRIFTLALQSQTMRTLEPHALEHLQGSIIVLVCAVAEHTGPFNTVTATSGLLDPAGIRATIDLVVMPRPNRRPQRPEALRSLVHQLEWVS